MAASPQSEEPKVSDVQLGWLLQERGLINELQLLDALRAQAASGGKLGSILVRRGCLTDSQLEGALNAQDGLRRVGVAVDLAVIVGERPAAPRSVPLGLAVSVPPAGGQGGLPHHGVSARQHVQVPASWLRDVVVGRGRSGERSYHLAAEDGRIIAYDVALALQASGDPLSLPAGTPKRLLDPSDATDAASVALTVIVHLSPDALRDGGAGQFAGAFDLVFGAA